MSEPARKNEVQKMEAPQPPASVSEGGAIIAMIERAARDPSVDIDKMERLMKMHQDAQARTSKVAYDAALAVMQPKLPIIERRGKIEVREKDHAGKRTGALQQSTPYALWEDINESIRPILAEHGFALSFRTGLATDGKITVTGILSHRDGHREETTMILPHDSTGSKNAVQAVGSSTSYGKRYTAIALLNITSRGDDDDGAAAGLAETIDDQQIDAIRSLIVEVAADIPRFCKYMKVECIEDIRASDFDLAVKALEAKRGK